MQFLTRPCGACPFRTDRPGFLGARRAQEIMDALADDHEWFACHKTVDYSDDADAGRTANASQCGGAMIMQHTSAHTNIATRLAFALGIIDPDALDMDVPVFDSAEAFVTHHSSLTMQPVDAWHPCPGLKSVGGSPQGCG